MDLDQIEARLSAAATPPLQAKLATLNGIVVPVSIEGPERTVICSERGLLGDGDVEAIRAETDFIINARIDIRVLVRALLMSCAGDKQHANYLIGHAYKEVLIEMGLAPEEKIFKEIKDEKA